MDYTSFGTDMDKQNWKKYDPKKTEGILIMVCKTCNNHHFHILAIGGKVYAQCGKCGEMIKI